MNVCRYYTHVPSGWAGVQRARLDWGCDEVFEILGGTAESYWLKPTLPQVAALVSWTPQVLTWLRLQSFPLVNLAHLCWAVCAFCSRAAVGTWFLRRACKQLSIGNTSNLCGCYLNKNIHQTCICVWCPPVVLSDGFCKRAALPFGSLTKWRRRRLGGSMSMGEGSAFVCVLKCGYCTWT